MNITDETIETFKRAAFDRMMDDDGCPEGEQIRAGLAAVFAAILPGDALPGGMVVEQGGHVEAIRTGLKLSGIGAAFRHKKTSHVYFVCGECLIEATATPAILYRSVAGTVWCRPKDEFFDGRFESLPALPAKKGGA